MNDQERGSEGRLKREIEHHRRIADEAEAYWTWNTPSGRRRAERRAELFIERGALEPGRRALELGCGTGVFLELTARSGAAIHGLDLCDDMLAKAGRRVSHLPNLKLDSGNAEDMPYADQYFDAVYGSSVLHHLDLEAGLREVFRVLKPGGRLVFAEPNILNPQVALMFYLTPTRARFGVSPDEMAFSRFRAKAALRAAGFSQIRVAPQDFLHPAVPARWLAPVESLGKLLERVPGVREIAGSLLLEARRP